MSWIYMIILGLSTWDDSSACIIVDGKLIAAVEEERFTRKKHYAGFPYNSIKFCLEAAGIGINEIDHVGHYWKPWILGRRIYHVLKVLPKSISRFTAKSKRGLGEFSELMTHFKVKHLLTKSFGESNSREQLQVPSTVPALVTTIQDNPSFARFLLNSTLV